MKKFRIISLLLALTMLVTVLSACSFSKTASVLPATVDADGRFIYSIIRGEDSSDDISDAAKTIRSAIKENMKCTSALVKDSVLEASESSYEILVGSTNRPESDQALSVIENNRVNNSFDFIVKVINSKICIQATTDSMVGFACEWFAENFCQNFETWNYLTEDYEFLYAPDVASTNNVVSGVDLGRFTVVKPLSCYFLPINEADKIITYYENYGLSMKLNDDIDAPVENEILIGDTSRDESKSVTVEGDNYVIKVVGSKIVVKGGNDLSTHSAVAHLYKLVVSDEPINWSDGYIINGKYSADDEEAYTLNFADEFESSSVNLNVWGDYNYSALQTASSSLGGLCYAFDPAGKSAYTGTLSDKMIYQSDGKLVLAAKKINDVDFAGTNISTYHHMWFKYGLVEINAKLGAEPASASFWLNGTGEQNLTTRYNTDLGRAAMTEWDILENYGSTTWFGSAIHRWWTDYSADMQTTFSGHISAMASDKKYHSDTNNANYSLKTERYGGTLADGYHTYSMYWDDDCVKFAFDGKAYCEYYFTDQTAVSTHCIMVSGPIFSNWMGRAGYGATFEVGKHPEYTECLIDYVRIYQTGSINSQMIKGTGQYSAASDSDRVVVYPEHQTTGSY